MKKFCIFALALIMLLSISAPALAAEGYTGTVSQEAFSSAFGLLLTGSAAGGSGLTAAVKILLAIVAIVLAALLICAAALTVLRIINTGKHMAKSKRRTEKPSVLYIIQHDKTTWALIAVVLVSLLLFIFTTSRCGKVGSGKASEDGSSNEAKVSDSSGTDDENAVSGTPQIPGSGISGISAIIQPGMTTAEKIIAIFAVQNDLSMDDYPESLVDLLDRNPETRDFVLSYPLEHDQTHQIDLSDCVNTGSVPLLMQWDKRWGYITYGADVAALTACGPVCLSMAALYATGDASLSPDVIIEFAKENDYCVYGNGSSWTLISEGGVKLGLDVTVLPLVESRIVDNLKAGNPVICVMGPGDFTTSGHFIVMTGYEDGKIRVNDPNSYERSAKLWSYDDICDQILNLWAIG